MVVVLMGVAGAGKSLQSKLLADKMGWKWLSTGDYLRQILDEQSSKKMVKGVLLPDETIVPAIETYLNALKDDESCILDGFPRNTSQTKWLIEWNRRESRQKIKAVIHLLASKQVAKSRLIGRGRADDHETAIQKRFEEYDKQILPIINLFKEGTDIPVLEIDGEREITEVSQSISQQLSKIVG